MLIMLPPLGGEKWVSRPVHSLPVTLCPVVPSMEDPASPGGPLPAGHQHGLAARRRQRGGDSPCGSEREIPMGERLSGTSGCYSC